MTSSAHTSVNATKKQADPQSKVGKPTNEQENFSSYDFEQLNALEPVQRQQFITRNPQIIQRVFGGSNTAVLNYLRGHPLGQSGSALLQRQTAPEQDERQPEDEQQPQPDVTTDKTFAPPPATEDSDNSAQNSVSQPSSNPPPADATEQGAVTNPQPAAAQPQSAQSSAEPQLAEAGIASQTAQSEVTGAATPENVEMLIPEPPATYPDVEAGVGAANAHMAQNASEQKKLPPAAENVHQARGAVTEPQAETTARAEGEAMGELDTEGGPSPEIVELANKIREDIRSKRPPDKDALENTKPKELAQQAGNTVQQNIEGEVKSVEGSYDQLDQEQQGASAQNPQPAQPIPDQQLAAVDTEKATPTASSESDVSLDADVEASQARIADAGMDTDAAKEAAKHAPDSPLGQAAQAQGELEQVAETGPSQVLEEQQAAIDNAKVDMGELQARAAQYLTKARAGTVSSVTTQRDGMVGSEEQMREQVGQQANQIYDTAQQQVQSLLDGLPEKAMSRWDTGVDRLSTQFENKLTTVNKYVSERHSGFTGGLVSLWDSVVGLPDEIVREYNQAEQAFGDGVANLLIEISTEVNSVIASCQAIIKRANQDINQLFSQLPESLQGWAEEQRAGFQERLDGLSNQVMAARDNFEKDLTQRATSTVNEVRQKVHALREKAGGLLGRISSAINAFLEDPGRFIVEGLLAAVGIPVDVFWTLVERLGNVIDAIAKNPLKFANNLVQALGDGFQSFFDNIQDHLSDGLLNWLFDSFGKSGIELPRDLSMPSIMSFFMGMMGITWDFIRSRIVKHAGAQAVDLVEKAVGMIQQFMEMGPEGLFELVKEKLDPNNIMGMVMDAAISFLTETLIGQAIVRIAGLLNPAGAILQGVELIYKVLSWLFDQAGEMFTLINTIVSGAADLIAGNVGGMAKKVHEALALSLPVVINFLARLLGLGKLPEKIGDIIKSLRERVQKVLDEVLEFVVKKAKGLLSKFGFGGEDEKKKDEKETENLSPEAQTGVSALQSESKKYYDEEGKIEKQEAVESAASVQKKYPQVFSSVEVIDGVDSWQYKYELLQRGTIEAGKKDEDEDPNWPAVESLLNNIPAFKGAPGDIDKVKRSLHKKENATSGYEVMQLIGSGLFDRTQNYEEVVYQLKAPSQVVTTLAVMREAKRYKERGYHITWEIKDIPVAGVDIDFAANTIAGMDRSGQHEIVVQVKTSSLNGLPGKVGGIASQLQDANAKRKIALIEVSGTKDEFEQLLRFNKSKRIATRNAMQGYNSMEVIVVFSDIRLTADDLVQLIDEITDDKHEDELP